MTLDIPTLALIALGLLGVGYALLGLMWAAPGARPVAREALPILLVETLIVGTVAGAFWLGGWVLAGVLLAHAARVGYEAATVSRREGPFPAAWLVAVLIPAMALALAQIPPQIAAAACALAWLSALLSARALPPGPARLVLDRAVFPLIPLVCFTALGLQGEAAVALLVAFMLVETFDSYALLGGKLVGRRKAFPVLSPKKTVEGLLAGAAALCLTVAALALAFDRPILAGIGLAAIAAALTVAGDLAASRVKRRAGVKDYPLFLPHQGGLLDTTDAWIATGAGLALLQLAL